MDLHGQRGQHRSITVTATGGNGGIGRGAGNSSGAGGVPRSIRFPLSRQRQVTTAPWRRAAWRCRNDSATGGAGVRRQLANVVSGTTTGNVTLNETAVGGIGGNGTTASGGAAGTSNASLNFRSCQRWNDNSDVDVHRRQRWRCGWRRRGCGWWNRHDQPGADRRGRRDRHTNSTGRQWRRDRRQFARQWRSRRRGDREWLLDVDGSQHGVGHRVRPPAEMAASDVAADLLAAPAACPR